MSTKSALRADLGAQDRKTLAEDRKRMEKLGKGSQLDDWLAFGPGLLIRRRLAKNIAGLAESDPAKGHRYSRAFKQQMEMDGLYDRTTKSDLMKSTFTGDGFSPNALIKTVLLVRSRRTGRLDCVVHHLGLALGGRPAANFAKRLMLPVSNDTVLRVVRAQARPRTDPLNVVGIDDWAFRRNHS
jgi:hypothetical protein